jgi:hypothetical protein
VSSGVFDALTGSDHGGLGLLLPLLMIAAVVAALVVGVVRWRRGGAQPPGISG